MITENLSTLKIHKLTQAQYDRELEAGNIDANALYLTPDDGVNIKIDATLTQEGAAADAKIVGDTIANIKIPTIDNTLIVEGAAAEAKATGDALSTINNYIYHAEKTVHFITTSDALFNINTDQMTITVNPSMIYYKAQRAVTLTNAQTVNIDTSSNLSALVYNTVSKKIESLNCNNVDLSKMYLLAILYKGYYTNPQANYITGPYKVNDFLYNNQNDKTVYVSTTGNDNSIGDRTHQFRTINKALASGATTIYVFAGEYNESLTANRIGQNLSILVKPLSTTNNQAIINLGQTLTFTADTSIGLSVAAYTTTADDMLYKVFVTNENKLQYDDSKGYVCNLWQKNTRLTPVLSLVACQETINTWFYDGINLYVNGAAGEYILSDGSNAYGIDFSYFNKLELNGITVKYASKSNVHFKGCTQAKINRCDFSCAGSYHGLSLENTSADISNSTAAFNGKDGFNIHGVSTADVINCTAYNNLDDGISHHDASGGMVIGGEYYNNIKGGVCSPTFGSKNGIQGVHVHHNGQGIYAVTDSDGDYPECTISDCLIENNDIGIRSSRYTLNCWNNILNGNITNTKEENGGIIQFLSTSSEVDPTLSITGQAADAKAVGEAIAAPKYVAQDTAPEDTNLLWIDTSDEVGACIKYYNTTTQTWENTSASTSPSINMDEILDKMYPVGAIYLSVNDTSPASTYGGTWEQIEDVFLLGAGSAYAAGTTGGSTTHTHDVAMRFASYYNSMVMEKHEKTGIVAYDEDGTKTATGNTRIGYTGESENSFVNSGTQNGRTDIGSFGVYETVGNTSYHSSMPPYLAVYMWKRIE